MVRVKLVMTPTLLLISLGGRGGPGGGGSAGGQGGGGGTGEAATLNYDINSEYFTVNLVMQDLQLDDAHAGLPQGTTSELETGWSEGGSHELPGTTRNLCHGIDGRRIPLGTFQKKSHTSLLLIPKMISLLAHIIQ
jgi:hypothetical protein